MISSLIKILVLCLKTISRKKIFYLMNNTFNIRGLSNDVLQEILNHLKKPDPNMIHTMGLNGGSQCPDQSEIKKISLEKCAVLEWKVTEKENGGRDACFVCKDDEVQKMTNRVNRVTVQLQNAIDGPVENENEQEAKVKALKKEVTALRREMQEVHTNLQTQIDVLDERTRIAVNNNLDERWIFEPGFLYPVPQGATEFERTHLYMIRAAHKNFVPPEYLPIRNLTIPREVKEIEKRAFYKCTELTSITIPDGVTTIGDFAFAGCRSLTSVILSSVTTIGEGAFVGCTALTSIDIPSSVTTIGESAFAMCISLTSITIPSSVTTIGTSAFRDKCTIIRT
jgi:hypothetical protein